MQSMDLRVYEFWLLFATTFSLQIIAISMRRLFVSLLFSLLYSISISLILIAMGQFWLSMANLWLSSGLSYSALIKTSILIGPTKAFRPRRQLTLSLAIYVIIIIAFSATGALLMPQFPISIRLPDSGPEQGIRSLVTIEQGIITLIIALMALSALVCIYLLVRRDDPIQKT